MPHSRICRPRGWPAVPRASALAVALAAALLPGCGTDVPPARTPDSNRTRITVRDDAGRTITLASPATRIVSLVPAQTEIVQLLGGPSVLIARTAWDQDPELAQLPHTENALSPSVEWITSLRPDLVVAWPDRDARTVITRLESLGIPVYAAGVESLADIDSTIARFGVLLGVTARADSLRSALHAELDYVRARVAGRPRPRVLYAVSFDPPMAASNGTWLGELIELAGGQNLFHDSSTRWPQVSLEEIVRRQPEVIIRPVERLADDPLALLRRRPGWRDLPAVRAGRVHAVDVNLLNRPGVRIGEAARALARAIQPDAFPEMEQHAP